VAITSTPPGGCPIQAHQLIQGRDLISKERASLSRRQIAQPDGAEPHPDEPAHRESHRLQHAPDLPLPSLRHDDLQGGPVPPPEHPAHAGRPGHPVIQLDPPGQEAKGLPGDGSLDLGDVGLLHAIPRVLEPVGQVAVVGQEQQPL